MITSGIDMVPPVVEATVDMPSGIGKGGSVAVSGMETSGSVTEVVTIGTRVAETSGMETRGSVYELTAVGTKVPVSSGMETIGSVAEPVTVVSEVEVFSGAENRGSEVEVEEIMELLDVSTVVDDVTTPTSEVEVGSGTVRTAVIDGVIQEVIIGEKAGSENTGV